LEQFDLLYLRFEHGLDLYAADLSFLSGLSPTSSWALFSLQLNDLRLQIVDHCCVGKLAR